MMPIIVRQPYMEMKVEVSTVHIIQLVGDVCLRNVSLIRRAISDGLDKGRTPCVLIDLSRLESIDLFSLGALATTRLMLINCGGNLKFAAPRPEVLQIIKRAGLDEIFEPYASHEEAIESFKQEWREETAITPQ